MSSIKDILYVKFKIPDLIKQGQFLQDFGFETRPGENLLMARGTDTSQYVYLAELGEPAFVGIGFEASSLDDVEALAKRENVTIEDVQLPGQGCKIALADPDGNLVEVVFGIDPAAEHEVVPRPAFNAGTQRLRLGERVKLSPPKHLVKRLGHCVLNVVDFRDSERWYKDRFGLITSDEIYIESKENVLGAFLRCDRGKDYVDHHTLFLVGAGESGFNHAAFEVEDWDSLMIGHDRLKQGDYEHRWGVGKHILGSQVFDYWRDPHGFSLEHFTDGDLFNVDSGSHFAPLDDLLNVLWGPQGHP